MNSSSSKIMLKNTSSMSLDERFTMILKNQQMPLTHRRTVPEQLTSSVKNQLLAQQMPNRPSVVAALQSHLVNLTCFTTHKANKTMPNVIEHCWSFSYTYMRKLSVLSAGSLFVGCGSAGRSARPASRPVPTREELDAQLDDYMSLTKRKLDAQLDAYMAEVDHEDLLQ
ncbi:chromatin target of PRMT1 protein [Silurus meridionalis]|nr:chromatin target of PRMT1 protein [Silurus meridionalis]